MGVLLGALWAGTMALFTDTASSGNSQFSTGSVDINAAPASALFNVSGMSPGSVSYANLTVSNDGTLPFTYDMSTTATNPDSKGLRDALTAEVKKVTGACNQATFNASTTTVAASSSLAALSTTDYAMAAGASESNCYKVSLPSSAPDSVQGATTVATFSFTATQS